MYNFTMKKNLRVRSDDQNFNRNVIANFGDAVFLEAANGMTPLGTIITSMLRYLTPSKTIISLVGALNSIVQGVPQLFAARKMETAIHLKPLLLFYAFLQRFMWFAMALLTVTIIPWNKPLFIPFFIITYGVYGYFVGQVSLVWINYMIKMVPGGSLGRFLGFRAALGSAAAIGGAFLSKWGLERFDFPYNYAFIFCLAGVMGAASLLFLSSTMEGVRQPRPVKPKEMDFLHRAWQIMKKDRNFQAYLLSTMFIVFGKFAFPLQVVYAQEKLGIGVGQVAMASVALMAGQTVGYLLWGWVVDHTSFKTSIILSTMFFIPSLILTYLMHNEWMLYAAVSIFAFSQSARNFGENVLVMEMCTEEDRPIYMGLRNGLLGPFFAVSTILGGVLTDLIGYRTVVLIAIPFMVIGAVTNWTMVKTCYQSPKITSG